MIDGAHVVVYTKDAEADRAFFRELLQFSSVDAGHGWLIFAMPPFVTRSRRSSWKHGLYSAEALAEQKRVRELLSQSRELLKQMQAG